MTKALYGAILDSDYQSLTSGQRPSIEKGTNMKTHHTLVLAALLSLCGFVCSAASASKNPGDRVAEASAQCESFRTLPERDKAILGAKYSAMSDEQFATAMKTCVTPNWQQKEHFDKLTQSALGPEVGCGTSRLRSRSGYSSRSGFC